MTQLNGSIDMCEIPAGDIVAGDRIRVGFATYQVELTRPAARKFDAVELVLRRVQDDVISQLHQARVFSKTSPITRIRAQHSPSEETAA